jgi:hypothetical protein
MGPIAAPTGDGQQVGDVRVRVVKAFHVDRSVLFVVEASVTNPDRRVKFTPWTQFTNVTAKDSKGNTCSPRGASAATFEQVRASVGDPLTPAGRIDSTQPAKFWLCFDEPLANAESITLELPADAVEQTGTFKLKVPRAMWGGNVLVAAATPKKRELAPGEFAGATETVTVHWTTAGGKAFNGTLEVGAYWKPDLNGGTRIILNAGDIRIGPGVGAEIVQKDGTKWTVVRESQSGGEWFAWVVKK